MPTDRSATSGSSVASATLAPVESSVAVMGIHSWDSRSAASRGTNAELGTPMVLPSRAMKRICPAGAPRAR